MIGCIEVNEETELCLGLQNALNVNLLIGIAQEPNSGPPKLKPKNINVRKINLSLEPTFWGSLRAIPNVVNAY